MAALTAADAMSKDFPRISPGHRVREAVAVLLSHGWPSGLVVDEEGRPLGVFGRHDVLRGLSERLAGYLREDELGFALLPVEAFRAEALRNLWRAFWESEVLGLARRVVPTVAYDAPLAAVAGQLAEDEAGIVAVVREGRVLGAVSSHGVLARLAANPSAAKASRGRS